MHLSEEALDDDLVDEGEVSSPVLGGVMRAEVLLAVAQQPNDHLAGGLHLLVPLFLPLLHVCVEETAFNVPLLQNNLIFPAFDVEQALGLAVVDPLEEGHLLPSLHHALDGGHVLLGLGHAHAQVHHHAPDALDVVPDACRKKTLNYKFVFSLTTKTL